MDSSSKGQQREIKYSAPDSGTMLIGVLVVIITLGESKISENEKNASKFIDSISIQFFCTCSKRRRLLGQISC